MDFGPYLIRRKEKTKTGCCQFLIPTPRKSVIFDMIKQREREDAKMVGGKNLTFSCCLVLKPEAESNSTAMPQWYYSESERSLPGDFAGTYTY